MTSSTSHSTSPSYTGVLLGIRVIVQDEDQASELYVDGFFGKPFGIKKPEKKKYREVLELSLFEALYLVEKGRLRVFSLEGRELSADDLKQEAKNKIKTFESLYQVYKDLRDKNFVVRSGMKFGSDFSLYKKGPGLEHAPFLIHVYRGDEMIDPIELVRMGRLSHSVRKKFMLGIITESGPKYVLFKWYKP